MKRLLLLFLLLLFTSPVFADTCLVNTSSPTYVAGQQANQQCDTNGNLKTALTGGTASTPVSGTGGFTAVTVGTSSAQASAAATRTARLVIKNESATTTVAVCLGACTAALNTAGSFTIPPGWSLTLSDQSYVPADAVNAIAGAASTPITVWSK